MSNFLAEKERFELSRRYSRPTPLAGAPLRPLEYFSVYSTQTAACSRLRPLYYTHFGLSCQAFFCFSFTFWLLFSLAPAFSPRVVDFPSPLWYNPLDRFSRFSSTKRKKQPPQYSTGPAFFLREQETPPTRRNTYGQPFDCICIAKSFLHIKSKHLWTEVFGILAVGDPYGNRTHIFAVRGRRLDRLTKGPCPHHRKRILQRGGGRRLPEG